MASRYPNTAVPGRLRGLLSRIPEMGVPEKATQKWLTSAGYAGGNAMTMLPVLRFVGVISPDGTPTELWQAVRRGDASGRAEFADAVRRAYADLFAVHPDAHRKDAEALRNFFRAHTTGGDKVQQRMVQTFKALAEQGDFDADSASSVSTTRHLREGPQAVVAVPRRGAHDPTAGASQLTFNINLQLQLPATADTEVYEKLFAAMRKHLMGLADQG